MDRPASGEKHHYWYACGTRSRAEKKTDRLMRRHGIDCYLPLIERERQWADRKKRVEFPLFPGYLFIRCRPHDLGGVRNVPGIARILGTDGRPTPVQDDEIEGVKAMLDAARRSGVEPLPIDYVGPGEPVRIASGPFEGMTGILVERRKGTRLAVNLTAIRQAVCVEIPRTAVQPLGSSPARAGLDRRPRRSRSG